jgi:hypothetical protein
MTTAVTTNVVLTDIEEALQAVNSLLPSVLAVVGTFVPQVAAFSKFLPLIQVALQGVNVVAQATGNASTAPQTVMDHLTPGAPNAPALS